MPNETIKFVKSADYSAGAAAGAMVSGPTSDGFVHVSFFREVQYPIEQEIEISEVSSEGLPDNTVQAQRRKDLAPPHLLSEKLLVATVSLPTAAIGPLARALQQLADFIQQGQPTGK